LQSHDLLHVQPETVHLQFKSIITLSPTSAGRKKGGGPTKQQQQPIKNSQFFSLNLNKENHKHTLKMWFTASFYIPHGVTQETLII